MKTQTKIEIVIETKTETETVSQSIWLPRAITSWDILLSDRRTINKKELFFCSSICYSGSIFQNKFNV